MTNVPCGATSHSVPGRRINSSIASTDVRAEIPWETPEWGHEIAAKRDLMGFTNAARRRCWKCKEGR